MEMLPFKYCLLFSFSIGLCLASALLAQGGFLFLLGSGFFFGGGGATVTACFHFSLLATVTREAKKKTFKSIFSLRHWARMTKAPLEQLEETWGDGECFRRMNAATENTASSDSRCFLFFHYLGRNILHLGKSALTARPDFKNKTMKTALQGGGGGGRGGGGEKQNKTKKNGIFFPK